MDDGLSRLRGTLPEAHRKKMMTHRGYNAGRGDDPHGVTQQDSDDLDIPSGLTKSKDFSPSNLPFKRVD